MSIHLGRPTPLLAALKLAHETFTAIGAYNGWYTGMTVGDANSAAVCSQRNNLDYLTQ